jgi:hypothetical protein
MKTYDVSSKVTQIGSFKILYKSILLNNMVKICT